MCCGRVFESVYSKSRNRQIECESESAREKERDHPYRFVRVKRSSCIVKPPFRCTLLSKCASLGRKVRKFTSIVARRYHASLFAHLSAWARPRLGSYRVFQIIINRIIVRLWLGVPRAAKRRCVASISSCIQQYRDDVIAGDDNDQRQWWWSCFVAESVRCLFAVHVAHRACF